MDLRCAYFRRRLKGIKWVQFVEFIGYFISILLTTVKFMHSIVRN